MSAFWKYFMMMLRYRRLLALSLVAALIDAGCKVGGIGTLMWVMRQFFRAEGSLHGILTAKFQSLSAVAGSEGTGFFHQLQVGFASMGATIAGMALAVTPRDFWPGLAVTLAFLFVLAVIGSIARFTHGYLVYTASLRTIMRIRQLVFGRLIHLPMAQMSSQRTAELASRVVRDCQALARGFYAITGKVVSAVLGGAAMFLYAFWLDPVLTSIFVVVLPPIFLVIRKLGKRVRRASKKALRVQGALLGTITESIAALRVVKVYHTEGYERRRFNTVNRRVLKRQMRSRIARSLTAPLTETMAMGGLILVMLVAAWTVRDDVEARLRPVEVLTCLIFAGMTFRQLAGLNVAIQEAAAAGENIDEVRALPIEARAREEHRRHRPILPRHERDIAFEHIEFTYGGAERPALRDVSLKVEHGAVCAVVGTNGSGKSTLLGLLPRLYEPDRGRVLVDGRDIAAHSLRSVRRQIAMVTQETVLFDGTVAENICYGSHHVGIEQVMDAARRAHAHEFICAMPKGYESEVGERGQMLSGGQRQRIAIARAILRNPAILILDEATSQIDADSEAQINAALAEFSAGRTTFVIAHRLSTVVDADMIVVMEDGAIVATGRHAELLAECPAYQILCRTQLRGLATAGDLN